MFVIFVRVCVRLVSVCECDVSRCECVIRDVSQLFVGCLCVRDECVRWGVGWREFMSVVLWVIREKDGKKYM